MTDGQNTTGATSPETAASNAAAAGVTVRYAGPWGEGTLQSPLLGAFNAQNLLLALAVLSSWDIEHGVAAQALGHCTAPPGRMEAFRPTGQPGPLAVVDFAHTPAALAAALDVLKPMTGGRLWCVFGCGGDRDHGKRSLMGQAALQRADVIVLTNDNPRSEAPTHIVAQIKTGCGEHEALTVELDRDAAIRGAIAQASVEDVVLVAGRGHETWQQLGERRVPLSDRAVVAAALEGRS